MKFLGILVSGFLSLVGVTGQVVTIVELDDIPAGEVIFLNSTELYSNATTDVDYLWKFRHDIEVKVHKLKVNGQLGHFFIFANHPVPYLSPGTNIDNVIFYFPMGTIQLLSWEPEPGLIVRLLNNNGVSILFHGNASLYSPDFLLEVSHFERKPLPQTTTTEQPHTIPPGQTGEDFVMKFITGRTPNQFLLELDTFKATLANMTNAYCVDANITLANATEISNVHIPLENLRFCSRSWSVFNECVEVTFFIVTYDVESNYVMTGPRIRDMWNRYSNMLFENSYHSYDPPPVAEKTVEWVWAVSCLGTVILIGLILGLAWLKRVNDVIKNDAAISRSLTEATDDPKFYERENPLHQIRKTMINGTRVGKSGSDSGQGSWETSQKVNTNYYLPSLDGSDSSVFRVNKLYEEDDEDEEEEYFYKPNVIKNADWSQQPRPKPTQRYTNYGYEDD